jgi:hypothetical protein
MQQCIKILLCHIYINPCPANVENRVS